uniref:Zinc finger PHD-type domain-containing protein n=2 Tax=Kalanchoe fedtschenkoi TaxID=63787 RepID=A0A7N0ZZE6_KALFE
MKSRVQLMDHSEDWVDGSWTVDCVCGVNFDDGEEMVDCDECGVWVHTRCSRYVKGEKSFACDKCKLKNNRNISEETEVAQLLVDLPKNTMKMEDSYRLNDSSRRPLRLWTEKPMEDRVHVHGIPGGDPQLFSGLSGIFTPQLWKCTGHVPKKFNFQYKEFACWDQDEERSSKDQHENQTPIDTGADALYSMSKETVLGTRLRIPLGTRGSGKGENFYNKDDAKEPKRLSHANSNAGLSHDGSENGQSIHQSFVFDSRKQRKDSLITSQDRSGKRKARAFDKELDGQKRVRQPSGAVFSPASNLKNIDPFEDKEAKTFRNDIITPMTDNVVDHVSQDPVLRTNELLDNSITKTKKYSKFEHLSEASPADTALCNSAIIATKKIEKVDCLAIAGIKGDMMISSSSVNNVEHFSLKEEVARAGAGAGSSLDTNQREKSADLVINKADVELPPCGMHTAVPQVQDSEIIQNSVAGMCYRSQQPKLEVDSLSSNIKMSVDGMGHATSLSLVGQGQLKSKVDVTAVSSSQCSGKEQKNKEKSNFAANCNAITSDEFNDTRIPPNSESSKGCMKLKATSLENNHGSGEAENCAETGEAIHGSAVLPSQRKMVVSVGRSTSTNSMSKSVISDNSRPEQNKNSSISTRKQVATNGTSASMKEGGVSAADRDGESCKKHSKESPRASDSSVWKSSYSSKYSRSLASKDSFSRSKDRESRSFSKVKQDYAATSDSGESAGSMQAQGASHGHNKKTSSGSSGSLQKGGKHTQVTNHVSSKSSYMASTHPHVLSASHAALSDEELALLLHQELNSSPRVPRIPRMRQAGSLPQSASPTSNMLIKRTSSFGVKDYVSVSRRKSKDAAGDGTHMSGEYDDKPRKTNRGSSLQDQGINEAASKVDEVSKRELDERSSRTYSATKRKGPLSSNMTKSLSSSRSSLKNDFDEGKGIGRSPTYRTLPGLISEIMSKGKRMTYEELCNAVLPHWHNLRKHNGERYAYSSHSQAVLDCLRNRSEWAQLVDRGPKTNPGRKRRKLDAEPATSESEDGDVGTNSVPRVLDNSNLSKQDDFPKGKRKARKRRRLALQGREVKDLRKSRNMDTVSEEEEEEEEAEDDDGDDDNLFSNSTEQSASSEDDAQGSGSCAAASDESDSSGES